MEHTIVDETSCRICGGELYTVYDLGVPFVSAFVKQYDDAFRAPLALAECLECGLIQLKHTINLDDMYRQYWYKSSLNKSMIRDLQDIVDSITTRVNLSVGDIVLDIGTNDGTLLTLYDGGLGLYKIGFDPALNLADDARASCSAFVNDYFSIEKYEWDKAKVVTAIAMFYDLPDPNKFVNDVKNVLRDDGVFVIQFTDLKSMLEINAIDNICHEHLEYYKLIDIINLMEKHGLRVFDAEYNKVNGGSLRVYVCFDDASYVSTLQFLGHLANEYEYFNSDNIKKFKDRISDIRDSTKIFIMQCVQKRIPIYGLGASTKGNTLLQFFEINNKHINAIGEINKDKYGLKTVGSWIPILPEKLVLSKTPCVFFILPWHFRETFDKLLEKYLENGSVIFYPLPSPIVITKDGVYDL